MGQVVARNVLHGEFEELAAKTKLHSTSRCQTRWKDNWEGYTGFIHNVVLENYLKITQVPKTASLMCGPPMMAQAAQNMLEDLGVSPRTSLSTTLVDKRKTAKVPPASRDSYRGFFLPVCLHFTLVSLHAHPQAKAD